ncbi:MAG: FtsQ-type POTRA domain-containing protein [Lachnospiraceae bacterium]
MAGKQKKKTHKVYAFFVLLFGFAIIVLTLLIVFYIQKVEVTGNEYCSDKQIIDVVQNDKYSVNSLYVWGRYLLGQGEELPCLEEMKVSLGWPWVLKVKVKEKQIVGYVRTGEEEYAFFDKEGMIVKKDSQYQEGLPFVEGIDVGSVKLYKKIESENSKIFEEILEASQELKKFEMTAEKIVCKSGKIYVYVGQICVCLGDNVTAEKIAQISPIIEKLEGKTGTLHLENYGEGRETITFKNDEFPE